MILESDTEAAPPSGSDKGVVGENTVLDGDAQPANGNCVPNLLQSLRR